MEPKAFYNIKVMYAEMAMVLLVIAVEKDDCEIFRQSNMPDEVYTIFYERSPSRPRVCYLEPPIRDLMLGD